MKKNLLIGLGVITSLTICVVVIYAQISNNPSVPSVEVNARFASADKNGDGVLSKEEFANYLAKIKQVQSTQGTVKICPETGLPCEHDDANASDCCDDGVKTVAKKADGEKGCCGESKNAETVSVKFSKEGETKKGGCCGNKDNAKNTNAKKADGEKGCCGDKPKETKKETNSADELTVTDSKNPVAVEKAEAETKTPDVSKTNSNDKQ
ncbi:MAG: hypothetical protein LBC74_06220 [Planctomycetaceae bacterium]|jgi:hypothetical protein|nr:hypothetical protein [Planctomycetaceae bacterium]